MSRRVSAGLIGFLLAALAVAACSGPSVSQPNASTSPTAVEATTNCPLPQTTPESNDVVVIDPTTCQSVRVGETARAVQRALGVDYQIKLILPVPGQQPFSCKQNGHDAVVTANTPALGFCVKDGKNVYIASGPGVQQMSNNTKIVNVWYAIAITSAEARFRSPQAQFCAAGFIVGIRPGGDRQADRGEIQKVSEPGFPGPYTPGAFAAAGLDLAYAGKKISACDNPVPAPDLVHA